MTFTNVSERESPISTSEQTADVARVRAIRADGVHRQLRAGQVRAGQVGVEQERVGQVREGRVRVGQVGVEQGGDLVRAGQVRASQVRVSEVCAGEVGAQEVEAPEVEPAMFWSRASTSGNVFPPASARIAAAMLRRSSRAARSSSTS